MTPNSLSSQERQTRVAVGIAAVFHYLVLIIIGLIDTVNRLIPIIASYALSLIENCMSFLMSIELCDTVHLKILTMMMIASYGLVVVIITYGTVHRYMTNSNIQDRPKVGQPRHLKVKTD
jgi:hypothetical protein